MTNCFVQKYDCFRKTKLSRVFIELLNVEKTPFINGVMK